MKFCDGYEASLFPRRCELFLHFIYVGRDFAHDGGVFRLRFYTISLKFHTFSLSSGEVLVASQGGEAGC